MPLGQVVQIVITGNSDQAIAEIEKLVGSTEQASVSMSSKFAEVGKAAALGLGAAAVVVAGFSIKAALDFETAHAQMQNAIKNTGGTLAQFQGQIDATNSKLENYGFTNKETEGAIAILTRASGSASTALKEMGTVADIARARNVDLATAASLVAKVLTGHVALLGRYGIATKDAEGKTLSITAALQALADKFGGQAKASAETFGGQLDVLKAKATDLGVKIGMVLLPVIADMATALLDGVKWLEKNKEVAIALAAVIGGPLVAAMVTWIATTVGSAVAATVNAWREAYIVLTSAILGATEAQIAFVTAATGIGVAIIGIAALGYGLSKLFGITDGVDQAIKKADESGKAWANHQIALAQTLGTTADGLNSLKLRIVDVKGEMAALQARYDSGAISFEQFETQAHKLNTELETLQGGTKKFKDQLDLTKTAAAAQATELERLATGTLTFAQMTDKAQQAVFKLQSTLLAASGGELGYQQSLLNVQDAQDNLNKVMADGNSTAEDVAKAQLALKQAQLASLGSAESLNKSQTDLYNEMKTGGQSAYDSQLQKLKDLEGQYPANAVQIQDQIDKLNLVWWIITHSPDSKTVTVTAYTDPAVIAINTLKQKVEDLTAQTYIMTVDAYGLPGPPIHQP